jgi:HNH endonuclease
VRNRTCSVDGCDSKHYARGWCRIHYSRWRSTGDPLHEKEPTEGCSIGGCERSHYARGYCKLHWSRWKRHGDPAVLLKTSKYESVTPECKVDGCEKLAKGGRGWCQTHYQRWYARSDRSDPAVAKVILGPEGDQFWAKVNKDGPVPAYKPELGPCWIWTAGVDGHGYGQFGLKKSTKAVRAHRYSFEAIVGPIDAGLDLDHLCRVPLCVNPAHLEPVPRVTNVNRGWDARGRSNPFIGVYWYAPTRKWIARIHHAGKSRYLGYFTEAVDAARAFDAAAREVRGSQARLNFPDI